MAFSEGPHGLSSPSPFGPPHLVPGTEGAYSPRSLAIGAGARTREWAAYLAVVTSVTSVPMLLSLVHSGEPDLGFVVKRWHMGIELCKQYLNKVPMRSASLKKK